MGFGLVLIGYITLVGVLPETYVYLTWGVYIGITGGLFLLAGFCKLEEYNIYFKAMKYISIVYILILLIMSPFEILHNNFSQDFLRAYILVSKITRLLFLFIFHFYLLSGISRLANEVENFKIEKKAKRDIIFTYIYFTAFILEFINFDITAPIMAVLGFIYFFFILSIIYSCYMRITYEGHDEAVEEKYNAKYDKNKTKKKR